MPRQKQGKPLIIGITGNLGCGKSTVARLFRKSGAELIDADKLAHDAISLNGPCYKKVVKVFGNAILTKGKRIDRRKLGKKVFEDKRLLLQLNRIIHPEVIRQIKFKIMESRKQVVVLDVPLLIESGLDKIVDKVIVVKTDLRHQLIRIKNKLSLSESEVSKRLNFQLPLREKVRLADFVIDNNGTIGKTKKHFGDILISLLHRKRSKD
ncbi:MAG: dephospho-CoA kinase [Candidatus Omnitrophota bacterium]|jgi:dephospho-CoA kinase